jgi:bacterioferritin
LFYVEQFGQTALCGTDHHRSRRPSILAYENRARRHGERTLRALAVIQNEKGDTMSKENAAAFTREQLIENLNEDLSREYQAIIAYVNYSQVLTGAAYMSIAQTLVIHAGEELAHALKIANAIDYLGGMPSVTPKPVKTSEKAEEMLRFDLENETDTIRNYRRRVKQADLLNEYAIAETIRSILVEEQDHLVELATALGIDPPDPGIAD